MNRALLAILGVIAAVAVLVAIARFTTDKSAEKTTVPPPAPVTNPRPSASVTPKATAPDPNDLQLEVKELSLAESGADRTSVRIEHPDPGMQVKLKEFLDAREQNALAKNTPLDCHAQLAKTSLISITCVTQIVDVDAGTTEAGTPRTEPHYESLTLRFADGQSKVLALTDVLYGDAGQPEVIAGCKKAAEPDLACEWPPTDFAIAPAGTLFICHNAQCIDIDQADAPNLLRPEFR